MCDLGVNFLFCFVLIFIYFFLAIPCSLWDLSYQTRGRTRALAVKAWSPSHWTAREFPRSEFLIPEHLHLKQEEKGSKFPFLFPPLTYMKGIHTNSIKFGK